MIDKQHKIFEINRKLQRFDINKAAVIALNNNKEDAVNILRDQMRSGQDAEGLMDIYRDLDYAEEKRSLASYFAPYPHRDLYLTGRFQSLMFVEVNTSRYFFSSRDGKTTDIVNREGEQIFELNPDGLTMLQSIIEEDIGRQLKEIID